MGALIDILQGKVGSGAQLDQLGAEPDGRRVMSKGAAYASGRGRTTSILDPGQRDYSASAVAYRCVHYIASNLASVDLQVLTGDEPADDHEVAQLWNRRPNPVLSARAQKELVFARLELLGEQMVYLDRGPTGTGKATAAWPIYDPVDVVVDQRIAGELLGYVVKVPGGGRVPLLPTEVLWLRYPHPFEEWGALAPWKAAMYATESDAYARAWQRGEFQHGARPSTVVYLGDLDEDAHDTAVAEFRGSVEGPENAGKSLLVSGAVAAKVERLTMTPAEMSYLESRTANADEVMMGFGLRRDLFAGQSTYENQRSAKVAAWSDVLLPKLEVVASETDRQLLPDLRQTCAFDVSGVEALRENSDAVYGRVVKAMYPDLLTLDEGRGELGLDPLPGGQGAVTLTEYRARIDLANATGLAAAAARDTERDMVLGMPSSGPARAGSLFAGAQVRLYVGAQGLRAVAARPRAAAVPELQLRKARTPTSVQAFYDRHERVGQRAVRRLAEKQERVVLRNLRKLGRGAELGQLVQAYSVLGDSDQVVIGSTPWSQLPVARNAREAATRLVDADLRQRVAADDLLDNAYWRAQTQEYLHAYMAGVWEGGAAAAADTLGISLDLFDAQVLAAMDIRAEVLAAQVTDTTRRVLDAQLLQAGVEGGESIDQLAARIRAVYADIAGYRAETIARTETVGGFAAATRIGALASGAVSARIWRATNDSRTRESHADLAGHQTTGMADLYPNGLLHPGDPNGPPGETINCRCYEEMVLSEPSV